MDEGKIHVSPALRLRTTLVGGNVPPWFIGLCRLCILNLNAACSYTVGPNNTGKAKELEGNIVTFGPWNESMLWEVGAVIPAGVGIGALFMAFGTDVDIRPPAPESGRRVPGFAVTMAQGDLVCEIHNIEMLHRPR